MMIGYMLDYIGLFECEVYCRANLKKKRERLLIIIISIIKHGSHFHKQKKTRVLHWWNNFTCHWVTMFSNDGNLFS